MGAEGLYCSELFYRSRRYAHANFDAWFILSAKHGLLAPSEIIAPYDRKLSSLSRAERRTLADLVSSQARGLFEASAQITSICGEEYDELLVEAGLSFDSKQEFALPIGKKLKALGEATDPDGSQYALAQFYKVMEKLSRKRPLKRLKDLVEGDMPEAGVYLFFDEHESRLKDLGKLRVVRVGTHGVANGSKASLRNRMRTHFGTVAGDGNHRSSVFRLHTGRSMINAKVVGDVSSWGTARVEKSTLLAEREVEQAVSKYLSNLFVLLISIPGESEKINDRAYVEQNLIALLSNGCRPLDPPSSSWLGLNSAKREIRKSGLWNVNHVEQPFDPGFLEVFDYYVSLTIGTREAPSQQLAPPDWYARLRGNTKQLALL